MKKTKRAVKKTSTRSKLGNAAYGIEQEFLIITGGGFLVMVVIMLFLFR